MQSPSFAYLLAHFRGMEAIGIGNEVGRGDVGFDCKRLYHRANITAIAYVVVEHRHLPKVCIHVLPSVPIRVLVGAVLVWVWVGDYVDVVLKACVYTSCVLVNVTCMLCVCIWVFRCVCVKCVFATMSGRPLYVVDGLC